MANKSAPKPNFFIVGAPKCGTTSLAKYLQTHPQVHFSTRKEPYYFGQDLDFQGRIKDLSDYMSLFKNAGSATAIGEGSTWYLYSRTAASEIRKFNKSAKIVIMLRNPLEMLPSLHAQFLRTSNETITDFESALRAQESRAHGKAVPPASHFTQGLQYFSVARYSGQVKRYFREFGRDNVLVIVFDDFTQDVEKEYQRTLEFLNVPGNHKPKFTIENQRVNIRFHSLHNWLNKSRRARPRFAWISNRRISGHLRWRTEHLRKGIIRWNMVPAKERGHLPSALLRTLRTEFEPEVAQLSELLNRDFSSWLSVSNKHGMA